GIARALVPAGADAEADVPAHVAHLGDRAAGEEFGIVRVCGDDKGARVGRPLLFDGRLAFFLAVAGASGALGRHRFSVGDAASARNLWDVRVEVEWSGVGKIFGRRAGVSAAVR